MFSEFNYGVLLILNSFSFMDGFMLFISLQFDLFLFLILAALFYSRGRNAAILYVALLLSGWALAMFLKSVFAVPRPDDVRFVTCAVGYSMPSGHSLLSFASAVFLHPRAGRFRVLLWAFAGLVALSRVFIGVHYPSDVLVGAFFGCIHGLAWLYVEKRLIKAGLFRKVFDVK